MGSNPGRTAALNQTRARLLAASLDPAWPFDPGSLQASSTDEMSAVHDGRGRGFALVMREGPKAFGSVLVWATRFGVTELTLMVDPRAGPGENARRATALSTPPVVMAVDGAGLAEVNPAPSRVTAPQEFSGVRRGVDVLQSVGLGVLFDNGVVVGEYLGLEVARVMPSDDGGDLLIGVGAVDQEANRVLHGGATPRDLLARVVADVAAHRRPGTSFHPLSRIARERWLMRTLLDDPSPVGVPHMTEVGYAEQRRGMRLAGPVGAVADTPDGRVLIVAASATDVTLIGVAADLVVREDPVRMIVAVESQLLAGLACAVDKIRVPTSVAEALTIR